MHELISLKACRSVTWVVVADSKTAHIYRYDQSNRVIPLNASGRHTAYEEKNIYMLKPIFSIVAEAYADYELGHNQRGMAINSACAAHNTYEPQGDIKKEIKRRFAQNIAAELTQAYGAKDFDRLILVAPARILGEIREQLIPKIQSCIAAVLPKNLVSYDANALLTHLQDTLAEAHLA